MNNKSIDMEDFYSLITENYPNPECIVEIGSLNGQDSLFFKEKFPIASIYAIEGLPDNYEKYLKLLTNINTINEVVCDFDGTIQYHQKDINGIHGIFNRGDIYGSKILNLPCKTFTTIQKIHNIPPVDIFKIDVEGASYEILDGMSDEILQNTKMIHIETEYQEFFKGQKLHNQVMDKLNQYNFQILKMVSFLISDNMWQNDVVLIKGVL